MARLKEERKKAGGCRCAAGVVNHIINKARARLGITVSKGTVKNKLQHMAERISVVVPNPYN